MMAVETMIARQLTYFAAREKDEGRRCDLEAGMAKLLGARVAWANADNALQIHGGNGFALEYPVSRVLCDARILNIFEGAAEIQAQGGGGLWGGIRVVVAPLLGAEILRLLHDIADKRWKAAHAKSCLVLKTTPCSPLRHLRAQREPNTQPSGGHGSAVPVLKDKNTDHEIALREELYELLREILIDPSRIAPFRSFPATWT